MVHELTPSRSTLPPIDDWRTGDSRRLSFTVTVDDDGTPKDISNDDLRWSLLEKPYHEREQAIVTDESSGVDLRTDPYVDPEAGAFEVIISEDAVDEWGAVVQRVVVDPPSDSRQSWVGPVTITARGGGNA